MLSRLLTSLRSVRASLSDPLLTTAATSVAHFLDSPASSSSSFSECHLIVIAASSILVIVRFSPSRRQCRQSSSSRAIPPPPRQIVSATDLPVAMSATYLLVVVSATALRIAICTLAIFCRRQLHLWVCFLPLQTAPASSSTDLRSLGISVENGYPADIGYPLSIVDTGRGRVAFWGHRGGGWKTCPSPLGDPFNP
ncbi:uncharacterized protein DS421_14g459440 [Arachis hypogaea]|nr:uncharacterized protein DS421_14g459440 [Arachis hypogaea]